MDQLTDNALMLQVKSGDLQKMGLLYERHKKSLFGYFYQLSRNPALSEDLVQNVFVRLIKYRHTYSGDGSFASWMFRTARNVGVDYFRNKKEFTGELEAQKIVQLTQDPEPAVTESENVSRLKQALDQLTFENREILVLCKLKGLKYKEVAKVLGCSEGAVKVKVHRVLTELKTWAEQNKQANGSRRI